MGENNYTTQNNQYATQNYSFAQYQLQTKPFPSAMLLQNRMFTASSSTPVFNTAGVASASQLTQPAPSLYGSLQYNNTPMTFYPQSQPANQSQQVSYANTGIPQGGQFNVSTSMPVPSNQATTSAVQPTISTAVYGYQQLNNTPMTFYPQSQPANQSQQVLYANTGIPQGVQFNVSTSMPAPSNHATTSAIQPTISTATYGYQQLNNKPPNLYQQSQTLNQPKQMTFSNTGVSQEGQFNVSTSIPVRNAEALSNKATTPATIKPSSSRYFSRQYDDDDNDDEPPPPSYEESQYDRLIRRSKSDRKYSAVRNNGGDTKEKKINVQNDSLLNLFDFPEQSKVVQSETLNPTQIRQQDPQEKFSQKNRFSQQSVTFPSDNGEGFHDRFSQGNQKDFGRYNEHFQNYRGGFRGHGNNQNRGMPQDSRSWQEYKSYESEEKPCSGDYIDDRYVEDKQGTDGEGNGGEKYDGYGEVDKTNVFIPDSALVAKYKFFPPGTEEMGEMFKDLVIHFFYKTAKNRKEQNPFVIICEAFRRSERYSSLEVEDGYDPKVKDRKFCTLRYHGMMMIRGVGENNCIKEARVRAGVELINKLAMSCYTLESKGDYFQSLQTMQKTGSEPGIFTIVPKEEVLDIISAKNYLNRVLSEGDTDVEYIYHFTSANRTTPFKRWVKNMKGVDVRVIQDDGWLGVSRTRSPQYWRDKLLASGSLETEKFILKPPQGIGKLLLENFDYKRAVFSLKNCLNPRECELENVYGPPGVGPVISKAQPPWASRGGNFRNERNRKKENNMINQIKSGVPLNEVKQFKFMSKKKRQKLRKKLASKLM